MFSPTECFFASQTPVNCTISVGVKMIFQRILTLKPAIRTNFANIRPIVPMLVFQMPKITHYFLVAQVTLAVKTV
jgi:hypothetical protein